jgi:hypothetical protein
MHIGLAGWSIHRRFQNKENPIPLLDFAQVARDEWGFEAIELNNVFMQSHDTTYLDSLKKKAEDAMSRCGAWP